MMRPGLQKSLLAALAALFAVAALLIATSPSPYRVGFNAVLEIWGDISRDLDAATKTVTRVSTETEIRIGQEIDAEIWWSTTGDGPLQTYVEAVGQRIVQGVRRKDIPYRFHVVHSREANAFAIAGGNVYITTAMLRHLHSEAELAAILGHEIAHVDLRHCIERVQYQLLLRRAGLEDLAVLLAVAEDLLRVGYSETMEREADRLGMLLATEAGYSPLGMIDVFRRLFLEYEGRRATSRPSGGPEGEVVQSLSEALDAYFDTHPPFIERLDALRALLGANASVWEGETFVVGRDRYSDRDIAAAADTSVFQRGSYEYLVLRAGLAILLDREREAERFLDAARNDHADDPRIESMEDDLRKGAQADAPSPAAPPSTRAETPQPEPEPATEETDAEKARAAYERGRRFERGNNWDEALDAFEDAVALDPTHANAQAHLGRVAYFAGAYARSIAAFETALSLDPDFAWAHGQFAWTAEMLGDYPRAFEHYGELLRLEPENTWGLNNQAWVLVSAEPRGVRDLNRARDLAQKATRLDRSAETLDTLAAIQLRKHQKVRALASYMEAFGLAAQSANRRSVDELRYLGCLAPDLDEITEEAVRNAYTVCIANGTPPFVLRTSLERIDRIADFAPDRARRLFGYLREDYPDHPDVLIMADRLEDRAAAAPKTGIEDASEPETEVPRSLSQADIDMARKAYERGRSNERLHLWETAADAYESALALNPGHANAHAHLGRVSYYTGDYLRALAEFDRAIELKPSYDWAHAHLAWTAGNLGDYATAVAHFEEAIRLDPDYRWAINNLAWLLVAAEPPDTRDPGRAVTLAQNLIWLEKRADYFDTLGAAYARQGKLTSALDAYAEASDMAADYAFELADDLAFLGCGQGSQHNATPAVLQAGVLECIRKDMPPFVLSRSLERIQRVSEFDLERARLLLDHLRQDYPDHPGVLEAIAFIDDLPAADPAE